MFVDEFYFRIFHDGKLCKGKTSTKTTWVMNMNIVVFFFESKIKMKNSLLCLKWTYSKESHAIYINVRKREKKTKKQIKNESPYFDSKVFSLQFHWMQCNLTFPSFMTMFMISIEHISRPINLFSFFSLLVDLAMYFLYSFPFTIHESCNFFFNFMNLFFLCLPYIYNTRFEIQFFFNIWSYDVKS